MAYGSIKADSIIWDNSGTDTTENMSSMATKAATSSTNTFTRSQSVQPDNATSDSALDMSLSNFIEIGSTNPTGTPTGIVVGTSGVFYADTAAPTTWHGNFKHPGGAYSQPSNFPAVAPWYIAENDEILVGAFTEFS